MHCTDLRTYIALKFIFNLLTSHRLMHTWFLKIVSVWMSVCVCVLVYVSTPEAINN